MYLCVELIPPGQEQSSEDEERKDGKRDIEQRWRPVDAPDGEYLELAQQIGAEVHERLTGRAFAGIGGPGIARQREEDEAGEGEGDSTFEKTEIERLRD